MSTGAPADLPDNATIPATSPRQVVLGVFVLGQCAFLVVSNLLGIYQDQRSRLDADASRVIERVAPGYVTETGHAWKLPDEISTPLRRWEQLTGQYQAWSLFAPGIYKVTGFPAVVFVWEEPLSAEALSRPGALLAARNGMDAAAIAALLKLRPDEFDPPAVHIGPGLAALAAVHPDAVAHLERLAQDSTRLVRPIAIDLFLSDNEPPDARNFFRFGNFRLRKYESGLVPYLREIDNGEPAATFERWQREIRSHVDANTDYLLTYLKWRTATYERRHPEWGVPRQVILVERNYKMLPPGDESGRGWDGPTILPLARWQPGATLANGQRRLERFNPVEKRFETSWK